MSCAHARRWRSSRTSSVRISTGAASRSPISIPARTNHIVFNLASTQPALRVTDGMNFMDANASEPRDPLNYSGGLTITPGHGTRTLGVLCGNLPAPSPASAPACR